MSRIDLRRWGWVGVVLVAIFLVATVVTAAATGRWAQALTIFEGVLAVFINGGFVLVVALVGLRWRRVGGSLVFLVAGFLWLAAGFAESVAAGLLVYFLGLLPQLLYMWRWPGPGAFVVLVLSAPLLLLSAAGAWLPGVPLFGCPVLLGIAWAFGGHRLKARVRRTDPDEPSVLSEQAPASAS